ncbi:MAG: hypothetical protein PHU49_01455 [Syntrophorhabdaceae bacterium]|nr:hypothetical protein [Syntrophorhabdaceae bacterium]MDD5242658.1 hypothetical protein [Syntrophorhabdaceae bacterium]
MSIYDKTKEVWENNERKFENDMERWLSQIYKSKQLVRSKRAKFHEWNPLRVYISVSKTKPIEFSIRFCGQEVAVLRVKRDEASLKINQNKEKTNKRDFKCLTKAGEYPWVGNDAKEFREHFKKLSSDECKPRVPEHRVESSIIKEMSKKSSKKFSGKLSKIQPVLLEKMPFQFPLPISASSGDPTATRGNIDILARRIGEDNRLRISVWELKKPHVLAHVVEQVYIYAVVLDFMLRSKLGPEWFKLIFSETREIPTNLEFEAVVVVSIAENQKQKFEDKIRNFIKSEPIKIGKDSIKYFVAYYDDKTFQINQFKAISRNET